MKRILTLFLLALMLFAVFSLAAYAEGAKMSVDAVVGGVSNILEYVKEKIVPIVAVCIAVPMAVYISFLEIKKTVLAAVANFKKGTEDANKTAEAANESAKLSAEARKEAKEFQDKLLLRVEELEKKYAEESTAISNQMGTVLTEVKVMIEALRTAFGSMDELVSKGAAREIYSLLEDGNGKENA